MKLMPAAVSIKTRNEETASLTLSNDNKICLSALQKLTN